LTRRTLSAFGSFAAAASASAASSTAAFAMLLRSSGECGNFRRWHSCRNGSRFCWLERFPGLRVAHVLRRAFPRVAARALARRRPPAFAGLGTPTFTGLDACAFAGLGTPAFTGLDACAFAGLRPTTFPPGPCAFARAAWRLPLAFASIAAAFATLALPPRGTTAFDRALRLGTPGIFR
jgi:hypothetical protein